MSRDDQFFALFVLLANLWFIGANVAAHPIQQIACALMGTCWVAALAFFVLA